MKKFYVMLTIVAAVAMTACCNNCKQDQEGEKTECCAEDSAKKECCNEHKEGCCKDGEHKCCKGEEHKCNGEHKCCKEGEHKCCHHQAEGDLVLEADESEE